MFSPLPFLRAAPTAEPVPPPLAKAARPLARRAARPWVGGLHRLRWAAVGAAAGVALVPHADPLGAVLAGVVIFVVCEVVTRLVARSLVPTVAAAIDAFGATTAGQLVHGFGRSSRRAPGDGAAALSPAWDAGISLSRSRPDCVDGHEPFCVHRPLPEAEPKPWWPSHFAALAAKLTVARDPSAAA